MAEYRPDPWGHGPIPPPDGPATSAAGAAPSPAVPAVPAVAAPAAPDGITTGVVDAATAATLQDPCSLAEVVRVEPVIPPVDTGDTGGDEYVEPVYSVVIPTQIFLAPEDDLSSPVQNISRKKTLINQGIFFDSPLSAESMAAFDSPYTADAMTRNVLSELVNSEEMVSLGINGNMFPHFDYETESQFKELFKLYPGMAYYANNLGTAREISEGVDTRAKIDTLRYVLRRAWMRMRNGAAVFQDVSENTAWETPFQFKLITEQLETGHSVAKLNLYPDTAFFRPPESLADLHPSRIGKLSRYVLGSHHPDAEGFSQLERDFNSLPLVPTGRKFLDIVHDVDMPFHEAEMKHIPPVKKLDVNFRVGSNFISDKYRNYSGQATGLRDAYSSFRGEKDNADYDKASEIVKFTTANVAEFTTVYDQQKNRFPMYVHIDFTTHQGSEVARFIKATKYENQVLNLIQDAEAWQATPAGRTTNVFAEVINENRDSFLGGISGDITAQNQKRNYVDFLEWMGDVPLPTPLGPTNYPLGIEWETSPAWLDTIARIVFLASIKELALPKVRDFEKIMKGVRAYSETIAYKVEKYEISEEGPEQLVQTFFIMDNDETDRISLMDTQVKHAVTYTYRIYAYNFVVGTEYEYTDVSHLPETRERVDVSNTQTRYWYDGSDNGSGTALIPTAAGLVYADGRPFNGVRVHLQVTHRIPASLAERHEHKEAWFQAARANREPTDPADGKNVRWTVKVLPATLRGANPTEDEVRREWENRQYRTRISYNESGYVYLDILTAALDSSQSNQGFASHGAFIYDTEGQLVPWEGSIDFDATIRPPFGTHPGGNAIDPFFVDIETAPKVVLVEVPFFEKTVTMLDAPPVFPNVHFVPFKGNTDTVRINLSSNSGEYMMKPIALEPEDVPHFEKIKEAQSVNIHEGGKIKFKGDDRAVAYEVYRMDTPPRAITDFSGHYHTSMSSLGAAATYDDTITPNKKYYYVFRAIDASGNKSNPTDVYCCRIVSTDEGMYLDVHMHRMYSRKKNKKRSMNRALYISAAEIQKAFRLPDMPDASEVGDEPLGSAPPGEPEIGHFEKSIWNKRYKIRVESKKTGKKVDINIKFKKNTAQPDQPPASPAARPLGAPNPEEANGPPRDDGSP